MTTDKNFEHQMNLLNALTRLDDLLILAQRDIKENSCNSFNVVEALVVAARSEVGTLCNLVDAECEEVAA